MKRFCALALLTAVAACGRRPVTLHIDPAIERWIPPDTLFIAGVDGDALRKLPLLPQMETFANQNVSQVVMCWDGRKTLVFAKGKFDARKGSGLVLIEPSVAVTGPARKLQRGGLQAALRDKVNGIPAGDQFWAALSGGIPDLGLTPPAGSNLGMAMRLIGTIQSATIGADLRNGLRFQAEAGCRSESDARHLHDALDAIVGLGRLNEKNPDVRSLYDAVHVSQKDALVQVSAEVGGESADRFLDLWFKRQ